MRKLALAIALVLILVGGAVGGMAVATSAGTGPTLGVNGDSAPGFVVITGKNWTPAVQVELYMDYIDVAHHVAVATPNSAGKFVRIFVVGPTTLGGHTIFGFQNLGAPVPALFTLTSTQQPDDRSFDVLNAIKGDVESNTYGLAEIKDEVSDIEACVDEIEDAVLDMAVFSSASGYRHWISTGEETITTSYAEIRHVSLTFGVDLGNDGDWVKVEFCFSSPEPDVWGTLDTIGGTGLWGGNANGVYTYEFDTDAWRIVGHVGSPNLNCAWTVTTIQRALAPD